jgi:hypothetical protein
MKKFLIFAMAIMFVTMGCSQKRILTAPIEPTQIVETATFTTTVLTLAQMTETACAVQTVNAVNTIIAQLTAGTATRTPTSTIVNTVMNTPTRTATVSSATATPTNCVWCNPDPSKYTTDFDIVGGYLNILNGNVSPIDGTITFNTPIDLMQSYDRLSIKYDLSYPYGTPPCITVRIEDGYGNTASMCINFMIASDAFINLYYSMSWIVSNAPPYPATKEQIFSNAKYIRFIGIPLGESLTIKEIKMTY